MKYTIHLEAVEAAITAAREAIAGVIRYAQTRADLSDQGRAAAVHRALTSEKLPQHVAQLGTLIQQIEAAPGALTDAGRADALPQATTDTGKVAAELEAARIMARPGIFDTQATAITSMEPSPTRTILLSEAVAGGHVTDEALQTLLFTDPEAADLTMRAGMLRKNFDHLQAQLESAQSTNPEILTLSLTAVVPVSTPARRGHTTVTTVQIDNPALKPTDLDSFTMNKIYRAHVQAEPSFNSAVQG